MRTCFTDRALHSVAFMASEVVQDNDVADA
jgi:hypothetical protein